MARIKQKTSARVIDKVTRDNEIIRLRVQGLTYSEIGAIVGLSDGQCYKVVSRHLERLRDRATEATAELQQIEARRLDDLQTSLWEAAMAGDVAATSGVLRIMERRSKLLGLDAQPESKLNVALGGSQTIERIVIESHPSENDE